jgi:D-galactarolactone isomerase
MSNEIKRPQLKTPPWACDTHIHFYDSKYPLAPTALGPGPTANAASYRSEMMEPLGIERTVIVQPTAYGTDNSATLDGIAALGLSVARGIAVVDDKVTDTELEALTRGGIKGARFHMLKGGAIPWDMLDTIAARVQDFGWHVQFQTDGCVFPEREAQIMSWPGTIVIDHVGKFLEPVPPEHPAFRSMMRMVDSGRVWVKLSAPYEVSKTGAPLYEDVGRLAKVLVKAAPERMLWASNWPHPSVKTKPDDAVLLDLLLEWAPDEKTRNRILADNPAVLYGF